MHEGWDERHREEMRPVEEAGGGEAEGFEQAEARLVEEAENFDAGRSPLKDAFDDDETSDPGVYGEADDEHSSEEQGDDR